MKAATWAQLTALLLITLIQYSTQTEMMTNSEDICRLFKDGVVMRKPGTCNKSIKCQNFKSVDKETCSGKTPAVDVKGKCVSSTSDAYCAAPCAKASPVYTSDPKSCDGWYQCNGKTMVTEGKCASGTWFDQATQMCQYPSKATCKAKYEFCSVVPKDVPFKDENNCHKYFICTGKLTTKLTSVTCETGKYYDTATATCIAKAQVDCYKHPYPENVCGPPKLATVGFVGDDATCRGYFYCGAMADKKPDATPIWGQCPTDRFFDRSLGACVMKSYVRCGEDRCDGITAGKTLSGTPGCQHFLTCANDLTISEEYCGDGLYFDAVTEQCTSTKQTYLACTA